LGYWFCLCLLFLIQGRFRPFLSLIPAKLRRKLLPKKRNNSDNGGLIVIIYYFQLAALAVPQGSQRLAGGVGSCICFFGRLLGMQKLPSWAECSGLQQNVTGVCVFPMTSPAVIMAWPLIVPIALAILLIVIASMLHKSRMQTPSTEVDRSTTAPLTWSWCWRSKRNMGQLEYCDSSC
jgi:hypothetical protein